MYAEAIVHGFKDLFKHALFMLSLFSSTIMFDCTETSMSKVFQKVPSSRKLLGNSTGPAFYRDLCKRFWIFFFFHL